VRPKCTKTPRNSGKSMNQSNKNRSMGNRASIEDRKMILRTMHPDLSGHFSTNC
jgi:hypothetical protein